MSNAIRNELLALQQQAGGLLQVEPVVAWAKQNPDSALHASLEWDDSKAGHEWRLHQVRRLIAVHIVNVEGVREMVSLTIDRSKPGGGYRGLGAVLSVPNLRSVLLQDALDELEGVRLKYESVSELAQVWEEVERVRQQQPVSGKSKRKEGKQPPHSAA